MGCAPGSGCCDECGGHAVPALGGVATSTGWRNAALHTNLGDTTCDDQGNCYDVTSSITYGAPVTASAPSSATTGMSNTTTYMIVGVALVAILEIFSRRR